MCQKLLTEELGTKAVYLTTSCSSALDVAALLLDIGPDSEVVLPSFTHPSTANAFALRGARLVFCDIRRDTLNLDEERLKQIIGAATRVVVPVHYAGVACALRELLEVCAGQSVDVVEDAAHGLFSRYRGQPVGTFGRLAATSFHRTKNLSCEKGGALIVNDPTLVNAAEEMLSSGTNREAFLRGEVSNYSWQRVGLNGTLAEGLARTLFDQLERHAALHQRRAALWNRYLNDLGPWAGDLEVILPHVPDEVGSNHHIFFLRLSSQTSRRRFVAHMNDRGISVLTHYIPLHLSPEGRRRGYRKGDLPVTEEAAATLVRLPLTNDLGDDEQARIIEGVKRFEG